jgi:hypothetical protein
MRRIGWCAVVVCWAALAGDVAEKATLDAGTIVAKMMAADDERRPRMPEHSSMRVYQLENKRFGTRAMMKVRMTYRDGRKQFEVLEQSGPGPVRNKVFKRMIESETEANTGTEREATRISPSNYTFRLLESDVLDGRKCFVLVAEPKTKNKFLFRGKLWVDAQDWAVAKIEASPAQKPSMWVRKTSFVHRYGKFGDQWLAVSNDSVSDVTVFGRTEIRIEYADYQFPQTGSAGDAAMAR